VLKRYSYRAYPDGGQAEALARLFGCCRTVFNDTIRAREQARREGSGWLSGAVLQKQLITEAKRVPERAWLAEVSNVPLQQSVQDADKAYRNFFDSLAGKRKGRKVGPPKFKSRRGRQSARFMRHVFKVEHEPGCKWGFVTLSKIGRVKLAWSRDLPSAPSSATVVRGCDGTYEVSFVAEAEPGPAPSPEREACGVDLGLKDLAVIAGSDGTRHKVPNPRHLAGAERRLKMAQRALSRKQKGSKNRDKSRIRVARLHSKVRHTRQDSLRKLAAEVAGENQAVALETLNPAGLARTRMGKSVLDAGWGALVRYIEEKAVQWGREVVRVSMWEPTSQTCSVCGIRDGRKPLGVRVWECPSCGAVLDRDYNAAVNIMVAAGLAETLNACGGDIRLRLAGADPDETGTRRTDLNQPVEAA
jgi:putative transposase